MRWQNALPEDGKPDKAPACKSFPRQRSPPFSLYLWLLYTPENDFQQTLSAATLGSPNRIHCSDRLLFKDKRARRIPSTHSPGCNARYDSSFAADRPRTLLRARSIYRSYLWGLLRRADLRADCSHRRLHGQTRPSSQSVLPIDDLFAPFLHASYNVCRYFTICSIRIDLQPYFAGYFYRHCCADSGYRPAPHIRESL